MDTLKTIGVALATAVVVVLGFNAVSDDNLGYQLIPGISMAPASVTTFTEGGNVYATTSVGTSGVLDQAELSTANVVRVTPSGGAGVTNVTVSLGASTTFPGIPNPGDTRRFVIENTATVATTTTIAAGTGMDLQEPDGQNVVIGNNNYAFITCFREASTDVVCAVDETIPAD